MITIYYEYNGQNDNKVRIIYYNTDNILTYYLLYYNILIKEIILFFEIIYIKTFIIYII